MLFVEYSLTDVEFSREMTHTAKIQNIFNKPSLWIKKCENNFEKEQKQIKR